MVICLSDMKFAMQNSTNVIISLPTENMKKREMDEKAEGKKAVITIETDQGQQ